MQNLPESTPSDDIELKIGKSAEFEQKDLSTPELLEAKEIANSEERQLLLSQSEVNQVLSYVVWTIGLVGIFLIGASWVDQEASISTTLLSLGIELLAGSFLLTAISYWINTPKEKWLVRIGLCGGVLLTLAPKMFCCFSLWCSDLFESAGIEILGGAVLIALFETIDGKLSSKK